MRQGFRLSPTVPLAGVVVALLAVGVVSDTLVRHIIQVLPTAFIALFSWRGQRWAPPAALPVFGFWLGIMCLIWLYLIGVRTFFTGRFTPAEIALTIVIGVCCLWGLFRTGVGDRIGWSARAASLLLSLAAQVTAMWISFQPMFANR